MSQWPAITSLGHTRRNLDATTLLSAIWGRFPKGLLKPWSLIDFMLLAVSALSAAVISAVVWANGAGGIVFPAAIALLSGAICFIASYRAAGTKGISSAYAQGQLSTEIFLKHVDRRARASLYFRAAVICLAGTTLACVMAAAFPGRVLVAPIIAALLTVVLLRLAGAGYWMAGGWIFDTLVPDDVILDMATSADALTCFQTGWTLRGRIAMLRRAAALHPDMPQEVRQIVLAQYSPQAMFVPVQLRSKSVGSELRLMFSGAGVAGAAMALAAVLSLVAVTLLPRELMRIPALDRLDWPGLQSPPNEASEDADKPDDSQAQSSNETSSDQSGASGGAGSPSGEQDAGGAGANGSSDGQDGGDASSGSGDGGDDESNAPDGGDKEQSPTGANQQGQAGEGGDQDGKNDVSQDGQSASDASGGPSGTDGDKSGTNEDGPNEGAGKGRAADNGGENDTQTDSAEGASGEAGGADGNPSGANDDGSDEEGQAGDQGSDSAKSQEAGGANDAQGGGAAGESNGSEAGDSSDPAMTDEVQAGGDPRGTASADARPDTSSSADPSPGADELGQDAESRAGLLPDAVPADGEAGDERSGMETRVDKLPEDAQIIRTERPKDDVGQELRSLPSRAGEAAEISPEALELGEGAEPTQAEVALELEAGGPAALFAEKGEVPEAVEARLLPDEPALSPSQATPGEVRQILPAWIGELMK